MMMITELCIEHSKYHRTLQDGSATDPEGLHAEKHLQFIGLDKTGFYI